MRTQLFRNIHRIMGRILQPLAMVLVAQTVAVGGETKHAAPCFEFYPPPPASAPYDHVVLRSKLIGEVQQAQAATSDPATLEAIAAVMICLQGLPDVAP